MPLDEVIGIEKYILTFDAGPLVTNLQNVAREVTSVASTIRAQVDSIASSFDNLSRVSSRVGGVGGGVGGVPAILQNQAFYLAQQGYAVQQAFARGTPGIGGSQPGLGFADMPLGAYLIGLERGFALPTPDPFAPGGTIWQQAFARGTPGLGGSQPGLGFADTPLGRYAADPYRFDEYELRLAKQAGAPRTYPASMLGGSRYVPGGGIPEENIFPQVGFRQTRGMVDARGNWISPTPPTSQAGQPLVFPDMSGKVEETSKKVDVATNSWERHVKWLMQGIVVYGAYRAVSEIIGSVVDNQLKLNDAMVQYRVLTGQGTDAAKQYMEVARDIGRQVGMPMTEIMPSVTQAARAGLPQEFPLYAMQIQRAFGLAGQGTMGEYLSLMKSFPGIDAQRFGDVFTAMMRQSAMAPSTAWQLYGSAAPIAGQFGMGLEQYAGVLAAFGRSQPERDPGTLERTLRRFIDVYTRPQTRAIAEEIIGKPVISPEGERVNLYEILSKIAQAPIEKQRAFAESLPAQLGQPYATILIPFFESLKQVDEAALSAAKSLGLLSQTTETALEGSTAAISNVKSAWQELIAAVEGGPVVIGFLKDLAVVLRELAEPVKKGLTWEESIRETVEYAWGYKRTKEQDAKEEAAKRGPRPLVPLWNRTLPEGGYPFEQEAAIAYHYPYPGYVAPPLQIKGEIGQERRRLPSGVSYEDFAAELEATKKELRQAVPGEPGTEYVPAFEESIFVIQEWNGALRIISATTEEYTLAMENATASLRTLLTIPTLEGIPLTPGMLDQYMGLYAKTKGEMIAAGVPLGPVIENPVFTDPRYGKYLGYGEPIEAGVKAATDVRWNEQFIKPNTQAISENTAALKALGAKFGSWLEGKLFGQSQRTQEDFWATTAGKYEDKVDEILGRTQAVVNWVIAGSPADKKAFYYDEIMNDPRIQAYFGGELQAGGGMLSAEDPKYARLMHGISQMRADWSAGKMSWAINYDALTKDYVSWVESEAAKKQAMQTAASEILKRVPKGISTTGITEFLGIGAQSPIEQAYTGGKSVEQITQDLTILGTTSAKGYAKGVEVGLKDSGFAMMVAGIWTVDLTTNYKHIQNVGGLTASFLMQGFVAGITAQNFVDIIVAAVIKSLIGSR